MEETDILYGVRIQKYGPGERDTPLAGSNAFCDRSIKIRYRGEVFKNIRKLADHLEISHHKMYVIVREGVYKGHSIIKVRV